MFNYFLFLSILCQFSTVEAFISILNCVKRRTISKLHYFKQDCSWQCLYMQSFDIFFNIDNFFASLTRNDASNRLNSIIFVITGQFQSKKTHYLPRLKKIFLASILHFFSKCGPPYCRKLPTGLSDFK